MPFDDGDDVLEEAVRTNFQQQAGTTVAARHLSPLKKLKPPSPGPVSGNVP